MSRPLLDRFREFMEMGSAFDEKIAEAVKESNEILDDACKLIMLKYKDKEDEYGLDPSCSTFREQVCNEIFEAREFLENDWDLSYRYTWNEDYWGGCVRDEDNMLRIDIIHDLARLLAKPVRPGTVFE